MVSNEHKCMERGRQPKEALYPHSKMASYTLVFAKDVKR